MSSTKRVSKLAYAHNFYCKIWRNGTEWMKPQKDSLSQLLQRQHHATTKTHLWLQLYHISIFVVRRCLCPAFSNPSHLSIFQSCILPFCIFSPSPPRVHGEVRVYSIVYCRNRSSSLSNCRRLVVTAKPCSEPRSAASRRPRPIAFFHRSAAGVSLLSFWPWSTQEEDV